MAHNLVKSPLNTPLPSPADAYTYAALGLPRPVKPVAVEHDKGLPQACAYPVSPARYRVGDDGSLFVRSEKPASFMACIHDLGHCQIEASVTPIYRWSEAEPLSPRALADRADCLANPIAPCQADIDRLAAETSTRSARRACAKVRRLAKFKRLDTMITLTYAANQTDRALIQKHHAAFARRVKKIIPGFEYVTVFELQKRGAWHAHMAVAKVKSVYLVSGVLRPSWDLLRSIWRSVIGGGGNVDVKAPGRPGRSISKLAMYLTKYISKGIGSADVKYQNSYQSSGADLPDSIVIEIPGSAQEAAMAAIELCLPEWVTGRLFQSPQSKHGAYFFMITPGE